MTESTLTPTEQLAAARYELDKTLQAMGPLDQALQTVPEDRLGERPVPEQYPVGVMIGHAFQAVGMTSRSARTGKCEEGDLADFPDPEKVGESRAGLTELGKMVRDETLALLDELQEEHVTRTIKFYFGYEATGLDTINIGYGELLHHRGQVQSFLRLMGLEPPSIYEPPPA